MTAMITDPKISELNLRYPVNADEMSRMGKGSISDNPAGKSLTG
jgi:hypothetical protein